MVFALPCRLEEVRQAAEKLREFLTRQGCLPRALLDCELALVEACNNAIQYALPEDRHHPLELGFRYHSGALEIRVRDHTSGFNWPAQAVLPAPESEHGRGLFLIRTVMDEISYRRLEGGNELVLRKHV